MKILVILALIGYASATLFEALHRETRSVINDFSIGLNSGTPLHVALGIEESDDVRRLENELKEELKKYVKDAFEKALKKIEDAVESGKKINEEALERLKDLREKMKDLEIEDSDLDAELEELKSKVDSHLRTLLEKMGIFDKRASEDDSSIIGDLNIRNLLLKLRELILNKMDVATVKTSIAKVIGQGTQRLCEWLTNKGKEKVLNFFDRILETDDEKKKRSSEDRFQKVKDYLENLELDIDNKVSRLRKWLDDLISTGLDQAKDRIQIVRELFKKIISESENLSKEGLANVLEYLRRYENEFGSVYEDIRKTLQEVLKRKD